MHKTLMLLAALAVVACDRSNDTRADTAGGDVTIGMTHDTVNVPVFSTEKDTIIVDKPVITGRKPVDVKRPTLERKP